MEFFPEESVCSAAGFHFLYQGFAIKYSITAGKIFRWNEKGQRRKYAL